MEYAWTPGRTDVSTSANEYIPFSPVLNVGAGKIVNEELFLMSFRRDTKDTCLSILLED